MYIRCKDKLFFSTLQWRKKKKKEDDKEEKKENVDINASEA